MNHGMTMLMTTLVALAAAALCATAHAQSAPVSGTFAPEPAKPAGYKTVEPRVVADYPPPSAVDPRVCLEFPDRAQIIACAEKYRPHKRRSQAPA